MLLLKNVGQANTIANGGPDHCSIGRQVGKGPVHCVCPPAWQELARAVLQPYCKPRAYITTRVTPLYGRCRPAL